MLGWINQWLGPNKVDGLTGSEYNVANGTKWYVKDSCPYVNPFDPLHDLDSTTKEVMGGVEWKNPAPMDGFAQVHFDNKDSEYWMVMHGFAPNLVPAISTLAENFAVFDKWYASLPGPTYPNRMYWHSGTSAGLTSDAILDLLTAGNQRTMMDVFNDNNISWACYYQDFADTILFKNMRELKNLEKLHAYEEFATAAAAGTLPTYTWVTPQFFPNSKSGAKDQHPDHDVVLGEEVIADVYKTVRNSPLWNKTLFIVTYDEHGGIFDHVSPPADNVPNPDGILGLHNNYNFTRLGVRVPTIMASPWIPKGLVVGEPERNHFEHSSMFATLRKMLGIEEELTNRTAWAATFESILTEPEPRTDCPTSLPTPTDTPERRTAVHEEQKKRRPNNLQKNLFGLLEFTLGKEVTRGVSIPSQLEMGTKIGEMMEELLAPVRNSQKDN